MHRNAAPILLSLLFGCDSQAIRKSQGPPTVEADDDGYEEALDCDDSNPDVHPGAQEYCDGVDNDCDGLIDDEDSNVQDSITTYADDDGPGTVP